MHYIVLGGGSSPEREVSQRSAAAVVEALEALGHSVEYIDPAQTSVTAIIERAKAADGTFPILHGNGGEDGTLQEQLRRESIRYFGPSPESCRNTFDKVDFKRILEAHSLPTPAWNTVSAESLASEPLTETPFVIKPIDGGSSIDTFIVRSIPYDKAPILEALSRHDTMLIEKLIEGHEITVGVLGNEALPVVEIIPPGDQEFDYENKYNGATQELCPPVNIGSDLQRQAQALAIEVHAVTACRHLSRTDMLIDEQGALFVIDTNTIPGLTKQSLYPKAAKAAGYEWTDLVKTFAEQLKYP